MGNSVAKQAVVGSATALDGNRAAEEITIFNPDGSVRTGRDSSFAAVVTGSAIGTVGKSTTAALPAANTMVPVKFTNGNSATSPTLAFATGGAIPMLLGGTASAAAKLVVAAGGVVLFWYDGTSLHQIGTHT